MTKLKFNHVNNKHYCVEALKLTTSNARELLSWYYEGDGCSDKQIFESVWGDVIAGGVGFSITNYSGKMSYLNVGDYLVRDINGFYTYQSREFEEKHARIEC